MAKLKLTFSCWNYDRTRALADGPSAGPSPAPVSDSGVSTALLAAILGLVAVAVVGLILIRRRRTTTVEDE